MTEPREKLDDGALDALFADARAARPEPSLELMERIAADAHTMLPRAALPAPAQPGFLKQLLEGLGGWPAIGGLVTATVAGVYIGFAQPELVGIEVALEDDIDFIVAELLPGDALFFEEG